MLAIHTVNTSICVLLDYNQMEFCYPYTAIAAISNSPTETILSKDG